MSDDIKIYADEQINVTPEMQELTQKGVVSLKEWIEQRKENGFFDGNLEAYEQAMQRVNNATVYFVGTDGKSVLDAIENGELHIVERKLKRFGKEKCLEEIGNMLNIPDALGQVIRGYIEEPAIIININNYKYGNEVTLDSLVLHEGTHALNLYDSESVANREVKFKVNDGVKYDMMYFDSGEEVYARLMQMRYHLKLDPTKQYTIEDVAKFREECLKVKDAQSERGHISIGMESGKIYTSEELRAIMKKNREKNAEETAKKQMDLFNYKAIFERYSDEQIMNLLNDTAALEPVHISDMERDVLRGDMQRDLALANTKDRVGEKVSLASENNEMIRENPVKQTVISDEMLMQKMNDKQYT